MTTIAEAPPLTAEEYRQAALRAEGAVLGSESAFHLLVRLVVAGRLHQACVSASLGEVVALARAGLIAVDGNDHVRPTPAGTRLYESQTTEEERQTIARARALVGCDCAGS